MIKRLIFILLVCAVSAQAGTFTIGAGSMDCQSTYINGWSPSNNFGTATTAYTGTNSNGVAQHYRALFGWGDTLTDSMLSRTAVSATLSLRFNGSNASTLNLRIKGVLVDWAEGQSTWDSALVDPGGAVWNTAGCLGAGTDVSVASYDTLSCSDTTDAGWYEFDVTDAVNAGYTTFLVESWDEGSVYTTFCTNDHPTSGYHPKLEVTYRTDLGDYFSTGGSSISAADTLIGTPYVCQSTCTPDSAVCYLKSYDTHNWKVILYTYDGLSKICESDETSIYSISNSRKWFDFTDAPTINEGDTVLCCLWSDGGYLLYHGYKIASVGDTIFTDYTAYGSAPSTFTKDATTPDHKLCIEIYATTSSGNPQVIIINND